MTINPVRNWKWWVLVWHNAVAIYIPQFCIACKRITTWRNVSDLELGDGLRMTMLKLCDIMISRVCIFYRSLLYTISSNYKPQIFSHIFTHKVKNKGWQYHDPQGCADSNISLRIIQLGFIIFTWYLEALLSVMLACGVLKFIEIWTQ